QRERHQTMFANALFTRMSSVKPQIKYRYLEAGFEITGDHPQAAEAKKVFDYYNDLTHELRLECVVDGTTEVGTAQFGVRVDIAHSQQIERESGGFAKYAQNQNNMSYAYNYGRPLENYRDRFDESVRAALGEHFEVLSVTWNGEQMASKMTDRPGWKRTPYAYLLLKARGPEVDKIPPIQMDFDFIDTSGYAILPIGSAPVSIDASSGPREARPHAEVTVTQLLDERRIDEGKVTLEIKAKALGLVPDLDELLELSLPGFRIDKRDDQGSTVNKFAEDQDRVEAERIWLLSLVPDDGEAKPGSFRFGRPRSDDITAVYQRYSDADLETVDAEIALSGGGDQGVPTWFWFAFAAALVLYTIWFFAVKPGGRAGTARATLLHMPSTVTPFSILVLLREIEAKAALSEADRGQLRAAIGRVEACHFGRDDDPTLDIEALAREWLRRAG
ncbi:MAG: hypothetical protein KDC98_18735, partial [Planctomycetes bacterium]|nr:hypothetical protein [Planctomycetota bacterium]